MAKQIRDNKISEELRATLLRARELLDAEFGCDHAYTILARGQVIWAKDAAHGDRPPGGPDKPTEYF
jgi:hypothetical protein